jgi:hypothetical protein
MKQAKRDPSEAWQRDPFFAVPRTPVATSEGTVDLPILYVDVSNLMAFFAVPTRAVTALLEGTGLKASVDMGGRSIVGLSFYEYRDTTVGVYNEVGLAVPVMDAGVKGRLRDVADLLLAVEKRRTAFYVVDLPVTTAAANAAGREIWGYPKFITRIDYSLRGGVVAMAVHDPSGDEAILRFDGRLSPGLPTPPLSLVTFSQLDGRRVRTEVNVRGRMRASVPLTARLRVGRSQHPMAQRLRQLKLDGKRPLLVVDTDRFQSRLNEGVLV